MRHTVTAKVVKLCPFRDEVDHGTVTLTFDSDDLPELHAVAADLGDYRGVKLTHEEFTRRVLDNYAGRACVAVESTWQTAGLDVRCAT